MKFETILLLSLINDFFLKPIEIHQLTKQLLTSVLTF